MAAFTMFSSFWLESLISGSQLLALVKPFKRKASNWGVRFQHYGPSGASCGAVHGKG
jgi:hypothetical protein